MYLEAALRYATRGWSVFPLAPGQKVPRKGTTGVKEATQDLDQIKTWWKITPKANIGIACGKTSNLFVIDIDPRHGGDKTWTELVGEREMIPTVTVATGGGGTQYYFQHIEGLKNGAGALGTGIDHRTDNGYVVAPPSLHPSGKHYEFVENCEYIDPSIAPDWIADDLRTKSSHEAIVAPDFYRDLFAVGAAEGKRNQALVTMAGHLIRKRLDPYLVLDILTLWNDHRLTPPGDKDKLLGIVDRVAGLEMERIMKKRKNK